MRDWAGSSCSLFQDTIPVCAQMCRKPQWGQKGPSCHANVVQTHYCLTILCCTMDACTGSIRFASTGEWCMLKWEITIYHPIICSKQCYIVGFEVLTAVVRKSSIFWDITHCSLLKVNWHFGEKYCFHLPGRRVSQARNQRVASRAGFLLCSFFDLKMETVSSSEMLVNLYHITWCHTAKDSIFNTAEAG
jgi:hypothetical protein